MKELKRTPIYLEYEYLGAKTIDFGGWDLPVQFTGIIKEHDAVRNRAGLFDVSHMGEIIIEGADSLVFLQKMVTNNVANLNVNKAQYTFMCNDDGGVIDDFLIYMLAENKYMLVVNAANIDKDLAWLQKHHDRETVSIENKSDEVVLLAIQGPKAESILQKITIGNLAEITPFRFKQFVEMEDINETAIISRTGYTGEDGFEIYIHKDAGRKLWQSLLYVGSEAGLLPAGLGARDSLRFEAGLPLYGQELSESISPIEAGLKFAVRTSKTEDFIGKGVLSTQIKEGTTRKLVGLEIIDKGIARTGYQIYDDQEKEIGIITTGTQSPTLKKAIAFALIHQAYTKIGTKVYVQIRKRKVKAQIIHTPFYRREEN